ncbi:MAG TPA: DUF1016 N-terminal domain-containing protein [Steroidobacteraceae bacterium]|nr:DUF1016 N-terminal domain-containing protein [Steroidobacteraceae bacterium]
MLTDIKERIRLAQIKASLSVNRELIQLYWDIGGLIVSRQRAEGWGNPIVEKLASDIRKEFSGIVGFSPRNVWRMRAFYLAWVTSEPMPLAVQKKNRKELPRAVADLDRRSPPQPVAEIPWGHNVILLEKLTNSDQRLWYARQVTAGGWSRSMLKHWIESGLYSRQGKAVTNFKTALSQPQMGRSQQLGGGDRQGAVGSLRSSGVHSHLNHWTAGLLKKSSSLTPPPPISHIFAFG